MKLFGQPENDVTESDRKTPKLIHADCLDAMRAMEANSIDAIVTDPPYGLEFMGKGWDRGVPGVPFWTEALRVAKPGAHLVAFGGTRTYHRLACAIEDAGWEVRDCLSWLYGCLSEDTEILINGAWVQYRSAVEGSLALCYDAKGDTFSQQPVQQLFVYDYDDTAYRIESEHTDQVVSRNHRCLVWRDERWDFCSAEEVARKSEARVPVLQDLPRLLGALRVSQSDASGSEQVLRCLCEGEVASAAQKAASGSEAGHGRSCMLRLQRDGVEVEVVGEARDPADLLAKVQREAARSGMGKARTQRICGGQFRGQSECESEDDGTAQPCMEGRGDVQEGQGRLHRPEVRQVPCGVPVDGSQGRVCHGAPAGSGDPAGQVLAPIGSGPSCRSRHEEQLSVEPDAVRIQPGSQAVRGEGFTTSNLARVTPFHYVGKVWCVKVPTGAFVARRNGKVFVTGNSGFPKSLDVSKAIDKMGGKAVPHGFAEWLKSERRRAGLTAKALCEQGKFYGNVNHGGLVSNWESGIGFPTAEQFNLLCDLLGLSFERREVVEREIVGWRSVVPGVAFSSDGPSELPITAPATDAARAWQGWGTALKPAWEPILLARKPLDGTVAANVLAHGTGALNIDGCRIGTQGRTKRSGQAAYPLTADGKEDRSVSWARTGHSVVKLDAGRWPANVALDEKAAAMLDEQSGTTKGTGGNTSGKNALGQDSGWNRHENRPTPIARHNDVGGASRFFYTAKASRTERGEGNTHPTVKPLALMRWLAKLVTPPGGVILDPFAGSGTTLLAAQAEGFDSVGIERESEYVEIARKRIERAAP